MGLSPSFIVKFAAGELVSFSAAITERIFNRDALAPAVPWVEVRWRTGEAYFEVEADENNSRQIKTIHVERFTCVTFLERVYELMIELGVVFVDMDGYFIAREHFRQGCIPAEIVDDNYIVVDCCDEFIERLAIIYVNCGPDAELRSASPDRQQGREGQRSLHDDALLRAFHLPC